MHLLIVIGTRPNFIKVTRFRKVLEEVPGAKLTLVHTGQHYDKAMSQVFFDQVDLFGTSSHPRVPIVYPQPDAYLDAQ